MRRHGLAPVVVCSAALAAVPAELGAQLRPLDPLDICVRRCGRVELEVGAAVHGGQRASLAGVEGRLTELGQLRLVWRLEGRVAFEAAGTVWRRFEGRRAFAPPVAEVDGAGAGAAGRRGDVGDFRLATIVTLASTDSMAAVLRFGTRLPTTDDDVGLERDRTDFFALVGGRFVRGGAALGIESGVGIHGTRGSVHDQVDVWLYSAVLEYQSGAVVPVIALVGQADGLRGPSVRGNEDLREIRAGVRIGRRVWARIVVVRGLAAFSPGTGLAVAAGAAF